MANLIALSFTHPRSADLALEALGKDSIELEDAAIVTVDAHGRVSIKQTKHTDTRGDSIRGGIWGLLLGLVTGNPLVLGPVAGALWGSGIGALWHQFVDLGIDDKEMKRIGQVLQPHSSALLLLVGDVEDHTQAIMTLRRFDGQVISTDLPAEAHEWLSDTLQRLQL